MKMKILWMLKLAFVVELALVTSNPIGAKIKAIAVFRPEESEYHKYSAVLAATEPFRILCDEEIRKSMGPLNVFFHKIRGTSIKDPASNVRIDNKRVDIACSRYERKVDEIVRSYGLTVEMFNILSKKIANDAALKQRVNLQSYYYRIAADLELNTRPTIPILPNICDTSGSQTTGRHDDSIGLSSADSKFIRFCKAIRKIENERLRKLKALQIELEVPRLPDNMCDPEMRPTLSPRIQAACAEYPQVASAIIRNHGLDTGEFSFLHEKLEKNLFFRWRVENELKRLEKTL